MIYQPGNFKIVINGAASTLNLIYSEEKIVAIVNDKNEKRHAVSRLICVMSDYETDIWPQENNGTNTETLNEKYRTNEKDNLLRSEFS